MLLLRTLEDKWDFWQKVYTGSSKSWRESLISNIWACQRLKPILMLKFEVIIQKLPICQKTHFRVWPGRPISWPKTLILNFLMITGSHIPFKKLRSTLGSFEPKLMTKIEVILRKMSKYTKISWKWPKLTPFGPKKIPNFEFFNGYYY